MKITLAAIAALATLAVATPAAAWHSDGRPEMDNLAMERQFDAYLAGGPEPRLQHDSTYDLYSERVMPGPRAPRRFRDMGAANPNASFWATMDAYGAEVRRAGRHPAPVRRRAAAVATAPKPRRRMEHATFHGFSGGVGKTTSHPGVRRFDV